MGRSVELVSSSSDGVKYEGTFSSGYSAKRISVEGVPEVTLLKLAVGEVKEYCFGPGLIST